MRLPTSLRPSLLTGPVAYLHSGKYGPDLTAPDDEMRTYDGWPTARKPIYLIRPGPPFGIVRGFSLAFASAVPFGPVARFDE